MDLIVNKITPEHVEMSKLSEIVLCENHKKALTVHHKSLKCKVCAINGCSVLGDKDRRVSLEMSEQIFLSTREHVLAGDAMCSKHRKHFSTLKETSQFCPPPQGHEILPDTPHEHSSPPLLSAPRQSTSVVMEVHADGVPLQVTPAHREVPDSNNPLQLYAPSQCNSARMEVAGHGGPPQVSPVHGQVPGCCALSQFCTASHQGSS